ncbi:hypothetical protein EJ08DRAFT_662721 [Tothia fuscella]|uniref:Uncharacterized protein n=1 Tax=Tothia fuscella TaxID=1048955 RepID=A0A9P4TVH6_9PEZI|nr:hypothetical protein EJ08DRAFT_662721 [Tothia fuscella]
MKTFVAFALLTTFAAAAPTSVIEARQAVDPNAPSPSQVAKGGSDVLSGLANGFKDAGAGGLGDLLKGIGGGLGSLSKDLPKTAPPKPPRQNMVNNERRQTPPPPPSPSQVAKGGSDILGGLAEGLKGVPGGAGSILGGLSSGLGQLSNDAPKTAPPPPPKIGPV